MCEIQAASTDCREGYAEAICYLSVDHCQIHFVAYCEAAERGPSAPAHRPLVGDGIWLAVVVDKHKIGIISGAYKSAAIYAIDYSWVMTHFFHNGGDIEISFLGHL